MREHRTAETNEGSGRQQGSHCQSHESLPWVVDELTPADGMSAAVEITGFRHVPLAALKLELGPSLQHTPFARRRKVEGIADSQRRGGRPVGIAAAGVAGLRDGGVALPSGKFSVAAAPVCYDLRPANL